ncbi:hypothetical protein V3C99_002433 [Haemonchus contortus]
MMVRQRLLVVVYLIAVLALVSGVQADSPKDKKQVLMSDDGPSFMKRAPFLYRSHPALAVLMRL